MEDKNIKKPFSVCINENVINKLRDYIYYNQTMTINQYVEDSLKDSLNKEGIIKPRPTKLKTGRKIN